MRCLCNLLLHIYIRCTWMHVQWNLILLCQKEDSRGSSGSIVSDYGQDGRGSIPRQRQRVFPLTSASRPALGPTQPPVQWVPGALSPGVKRGRSVMLTAHPLLVPRLRKSRSYTSCHPNAPLWSVTGPLYHYITVTETNRVGKSLQINCVLTKQLVYFYGSDTVCR
jgi:hypothetical protein